MIGKTVEFKYTNGVKAKGIILDKILLTADMNRNPSDHYLIEVLESKQIVAIQCFKIVKIMLEDAQDRLTDHSLMPFGKHKGLTMEEVPADYLLYLYDQDIAYGEVKDYIKENEDVLRLEVKRKSK